MRRTIQATVFLVCSGFGVSLAIMISGCASGESVTQATFDVSKIQEVAVVDVLGAIQGETAKNQISDFFGMELLKKGYTPVERTQLQSLMKEQQFQTLDISIAEGVVKAGRLLNVSTVLVINVQSSDEMSMTAKMIDVEKGTMLWMGSGSWETGTGMLSRIGFTASEDDAGSKATAGAPRRVSGTPRRVLGGADTEAMSAQQCQMAKKVIAKICESLPSKIPAPAKQ